MYELGDRFVALCDTGGPKKGDKGTVVQILRYNNGYIYGLKIEWDEFSNGHGCSGRCQKANHGWNFSTKSVGEQIQLIEEDLICDVDAIAMKELL